MGTEATEYPDFHESGITPTGDGTIPGSFFEIFNPPTVDGSQPEPEPDESAN